MRSTYLLQLTALAAIAAGCRSEVREELSGSAPERDLTLVTPTADLKIASLVERQQPRIERRQPRVRKPAARPAAVPHSTPIEPQVQLAAVAVSAPAPANDRELLPGKTVTLIPASSGPSAGPDDIAEIPTVHGRTMVGHGGGRCPRGGRRPGIGIAGAPRPDFR